MPLLAAHGSSLYSTSATPVRRNTGRRRIRNRVRPLQCDSFPPRWPLQNFPTLGRGRGRTVELRSAGTPDREPVGVLDAWMWAHEKRGKDGVRPDLTNPDTPMNTGVWKSGLSIIEIYFFIHSRRRLWVEMRRSPFSAIGQFLTLIQQAKLQPSHAIIRVHEGSIERQIFAVKLSVASFVNAKVP